MDLSSVSDGWVALSMGFIMSPHCLLMCGPIAFVALASKEGQGPSPFKLHLLYNTTRTLSFVTLGVLAGFLSLSITQILDHRIVAILPLLLIILFVLYILGFEHIIPRIPFSSKFLAPLNHKLHRQPKSLAALGLGLITPLMPCAPLYLILWACVLSADPFQGGTIMLGYALGTIPAMLLITLNWKFLQPKLSQKYVKYLQKALALFVIYMLWQRLSVASPFDGLCCPW